MLSSFVILTSMIGEKSPAQMLGLSKRCFHGNGKRELGRSLGGQARAAYESRWHLEFSTKTELLRRASSRGGLWGAGQSKATRQGVQ